MSYTKCLRCNKELRNENSKKFGYGKTCYRIIQMEKQLKVENIDSDKIKELTEIIQFLKCEINMIKTQMKTLKMNSSITVNSIERIKSEVKRPEQNLKINDMNNCLKEMKELFNQNTDIKSFLVHIEVKR